MELKSLTQAPAPWTYYPDRNVVGDASGLLVASLAFISKIDGELIASAPDLARKVGELEPQVMQLRVVNHDLADVLRALEWNNESFCPWCMGKRPKHEGICKLEQMIAKGYIIEKKPVAEGDDLKLQIREYQAAVRKVDDCCSCLDYEPFKDLPRGEKEDPCTGCERESIRCSKISPKVSGDSCCEDCSHVAARKLCEKCGKDYCICRITAAKIMPCRSCGFFHDGNTGCPRAEGV